MADPGGLDWLPAVARAAGVTVVEHPGWRGRTRPGRFTPAGILAHHTGPGTDDMLVRLCIRGRADLPGPLCHIVATRDGVWHLIADGNANHAGAGALPWDPTGAATGGNGQLIGIEITNTGDGTDPYPDCQIDAFLAGVGAILSDRGWGLDRVTTHADFARPAGRKTDPRGPAWISPGPSTWTPTELRAALEEHTMPLSDDDVARIWAYPIMSTSQVVSPAENVLRWTHHFAEVAAGRPLVDIEELARRLAAELPGLTPAVVRDAVLQALRDHPLGPRG